MTRVERVNPLLKKADFHREMALTASSRRSPLVEKVRTGIVSESNDSVIRNMSRPARMARIAEISRQIPERDSARASNWASKLATMQNVAGYGDRHSRNSQNFGNTYEKEDAEPDPLLAKALLDAARTDERSYEELVAGSASSSPSDFSMDSSSSSGPGFSSSPQPRLTKSLSRALELGRLASEVHAEIERGKGSGSASNHRIEVSCDLTSTEIDRLAARVQDRLEANKATFLTSTTSRGAREGGEEDSDENRARCTVLKIVARCNQFIQYPHEREILERRYRKISLSAAEMRGLRGYFRKTSRGERFELGADFQVELQLEENLEENGSENLEGWALRGGAQTLELLTARALAPRAFDRILRMVFQGALEAAEEGEEAEEVDTGLESLRRGDVHGFLSRRASVKLPPELARQKARLRQQGSDGLIDAFPDNPVLSEIVARARRAGDCAPLAQLTPDALYSATGVERKIEPLAELRTDGSEFTAEDNEIFLERARANMTRAKVDVSFPELARLPDGVVWGHLDAADHGGENFKTDFLLERTGALSFWSWRASGQGSYPVVGVRRCEDDVYELLHILSSPHNVAGFESNAGLPKQDPFKCLKINVLEPKNFCQANITAGSVARTLTKAFLGDEGADAMIRKVFLRSQLRKKVLEGVDGGPLNVGPPGPGGGGSQRETQQRVEPRQPLGFAQVPSRARRAAGRGRCGEFFGKFF